MRTHTRTLATPPDHGRDALDLLVPCWTDTGDHRMGKSETPGAATPETGSAVQWCHEVTDCFCVACHCDPRRCCPTDICCWHHQRQHHRQRNLWASRHSTRKLFYNRTPTWGIWRI